MKQKLGLYTQLLPTMDQLLSPPVAARMNQRGIQRDGEGTTALYVRELVVHADDLSTATVFDCRALPLGFVKDTGDAAFEEAVETKEPIRLPYPSCYFEFDDGVSMFAKEIRYRDKLEENRMPGEAASAYGEFIDTRVNKMDDPVAVSVRFYNHKTWERDFLAAYSAVEDSGDIPGDPLPFIQAIKELTGLSGYFFNGIEPVLFGFGGWIGDDSFFDVGYRDDIATQVAGKLGDVLNFARETGSDDRPVFTPEQDQLARDLASKSKEHLLGVLTLLRDRLVVDSVERDPAKWWTRQRAKKGKPPTSGDVHVLTVNVPAVREAARRNSPVGSHESPALHWRRGHWRVLHRSSEFESRTWVRRCLCGDPNKGFVSKGYKLVHDMPMLAASQSHQLLAEALE